MIMRPRRDFFAGAAGAEVSLDMCRFGSVNVLPDTEQLKCPGKLPITDRIPWKMGRIRERRSSDRAGVPTRPTDCRHVRGVGTFESFGPFRSFEPFELVRAVRAVRAVRTSERFERRERSERPHEPNGPNDP